jgi:hypothetical protein
MRVTRLRASPRHGASGIFQFESPILMTDPPRGRPFGVAAVILYWSGEVPMDKINFKTLVENNCSWEFFRI